MLRTASPAVVSSQVRPNSAGPVWVVSQPREAASAISSASLRAAVALVLNPR